LDTFPNFGGSAPSTITGLDNALPGDIIVYQPRRYAVNSSVGVPYGLPQIFYVTDIGGYATAGDVMLPDDAVVYFDYNIGKFRRGNYGSGGPVVYPTRVFVQSWDQGKFPTSTGLSISWGMGPEKTIYKSSAPENYRRDICRDAPDVNSNWQNKPDQRIRALTDLVPQGTQPISMQRYCRDNMNKAALNSSTCLTRNCQPSCLDSDYSACVLPNGAIDWNLVKVYRPSTNVRACTDSNVVSTLIPPIPSPLNINTTYNWQQTWQTAASTASGDVRLNLPDETVIYQARTQLVPTNFWSWCVNAGYDPPHHFVTEYKGAMTGAITDTTMCAPLPYARGRADGLARDSGCSSRPDEIHFPFPKSQIR
jgi:hypothetical protein